MPVRRHLAIPVPIPLAQLMQVMPAPCHPLIIYKNKYRAQLLPWQNQIWMWRRRREPHISECGAHIHRLAAAPPPRNPRTLTSAPRESNILSALRKQTRRTERDQNGPRRPIKDADGSELFKLQVWRFLCISLPHWLLHRRWKPEPENSKLDAGLIGEIFTCHNRRNRSCSCSCSGSCSSRVPGLGYAQEFNFAAGIVTAIVWVCGQGHGGCGGWGGRKRLGQQTQARRRWPCAGFKWRNRVHIVTMSEMRRSICGLTRTEREELTHEWIK